MSESKISCQGWELGPDAFHLADPSQGRSWANYLSNGDYGLRLNQFASGYSSTLQEPRMLVTHHGWNQETKGRYVYLTEKDDPDAALWNPGFLPCRTPVEGYQATHGLGWSQFEARRRNLGCESLHFLPRAGAFEIWRIRVVNRGSHPVRATVVAQAEFLLQASAAIDVPYYSWYQDVGPLADRTGVVVPSATPGSPRSVGFFRSLVRPSGFEGNLRSFHGT
ncbi:MAG TPA: hypothetical protein VMB23_05600, partial [Spirochaetia bacterium]|nr:hypothetical protein [Spirochaetia bacterium]